MRKVFYRRHFEQREDPGDEVVLCAAKLRSVCPYLILVLSFRLVEAALNVVLGNLNHLRVPRVR